MRLLNRTPSLGRAILLGALPFLAVIVIYLLASDMRLAANPNDKLLPSLASFAEAIQGFALEPDKRTGEYQLWADTTASLTRLGLGLALSALIGLVFGILTGLIPYARATLSPFIAALSLIPPLALLPVLFIVFGLGEVAKVVLIVIGIAPFIMRDVALRVAELPHELLIKAQTLGGSTWQIALRVILPQMLPRLIDALRLALGAAWLFLIAAEAIAAEDGLGYRIFLVRRYLAMDVILPYVAWITLLAFLMDQLLRQASRRLFPWYHVGSART
ncbi:MAG: ABC transporter permease [Pseudomonadota bacterium]|jgi:NitT/TauT family transport system permease protein